MGFDIDICECSFSNGVAYIENICDTAYLSYNWGDFSDLCLEHYLQGKSNCKCENKQHIWYFRDDCDGRRGYDISGKIIRALNIFESHGIIEGNPDPDNKNWYWGLDKEGKRLPPRERASAFIYRLKYLLNLSQKYPECFFVGDMTEEKELHLHPYKTVPLISSDLGTI